MTRSDSSGNDATPDFGFARPHRWTGLVPLALSLVLILIFGALLWFFRADKNRSLKAERVETAHAVRESIHLRIDGNRDYLLLLAEDRANGRLHPEDFRQKASLYVADHPELINITWVDSRFVIQGVAPLEGNRQIIGLSLSLPEPKRASRLAMEGRQAVYTRPFEAIQGRASFEIWVPVFRGDRFLGLFAGVYSCGKLMEVVPRSIIGQDHLTLVDGSGAVLRSDPAIRQRNPRMEVELPLTPPGYGVKVRLQSYGGKEWGWEITLLAIVCIALILGMGYGMWALNRELNRRALAEDALRDSEERFRAIFENSMDGILRTAPDGDILAANPAACEMLGRTEEEIRKAGRAGIVDPSDPRLPGLLEERARTGMAQGELTFVRKDGTKFPVYFSSRVYRDRQGHLRTSMAIRDITGRKRAEEALRESEQKYRVLVANADEAIFIAQDETVKFPNPKALEMTGYSAEELAGVPVTDLIHPEDRDKVLERHFDRLRGGAPPETYPFRILNRAGGEIWAQLTAVRIDWEGRPGVLCFLRDVTRERNLEAQFLQSQKIEAVGRLAGGIAHDFNNLLTVTIGYCDLALARVGALDPLRHDLEEIRKSSDRCAALTRQLLAFSRKQILVPKVIHLGDVVTDLEKMLRRLIGEDVDLVSAGGEDLWNVKADPGQIEQVIVNLVVNARDAMPRGGKLTIGTANVVLDETYSAGHKYVSPGSYVLLAVSDTGTGMDEETVARIFEPFFTTKEKGTGLGLSTVYGIVKQSGGHINVYSEPGIGTTFKLYFPAVEERVAGIPGAGVLPPGGLRGGETILLVEDEEPVRRMVREILTQYGYSVLEARTGGEAVDLCSRREGTIHLMLTDVVMPGMNGVELSKRLAPVQPGMKVLFMSGYTADAIVHQGILDPGIAFLHKPFTMDALAHKVREVLGPGSPENGS